MSCRRQFSINCGFAARYVMSSSGWKKCLTLWFPLPNVSEPFWESQAQIYRKVQAKQGTIQTNAARS